MNRQVLLLSVIVATQVSAQAPMSVCEVLRSPQRFDGRRIAIRGRYFANDHGAVFTDRCSPRKAGDRFAVADWSLYKGDTPKLDAIVRYRDQSGRPSVMDGMVTVVVRVKAIRGFRSHYDESTDQDVGNGEGYNGMGAARFLIISIDVATQQIQQHAP